MKSPERRSTLCPSALASLLVLLTLLTLPPLHTAPLAAQPPPEAPPAPLATDRFEDTSDVLAIEVPINVVGRDGKPVRGLTAADFEVFDEGDRQAVTNFEVVDLDVLTPQGKPTAAAVAPVRDLSQEPLDSTARRHFLLLFDLTFSSPTAVLRARLAAREFLLNALHPTDLAAVATFSLEPRAAAGRHLHPRPRAARPRHRHPRRAPPERPRRARSAAFHDRPPPTSTAPAAAAAAATTTIPAACATCGRRSIRPCSST